MHGSYSLYSNLCTNITLRKESIIEIKSGILGILVQKSFSFASKQIRHIVHSTPPNDGVRAGAALRSGVFGAAAAPECLGVIRNLQRLSLG